jgi:CD109 antigen
MFGRMDFNKFITAQIKATENLQYLYYQVIGRGGVLASHQVNPRNSKVFTFRFWATFAMVPKAKLIVYYYRPDGEIVSDRVELMFDNRLDNYVSINLFAKQSE